MKQTNWPESVAHSFLFSLEYSTLIRVSKCLTYL